MSTKPPHREDNPPRRCKKRGCKTWLTSANEDPYCWEHGGWSTLRLRSLEALGGFKGGGIHDHDRVGAALEEMLR